MSESTEGNPIYWSFINGVACPQKAHVYFSLLPLLSTSPSMKHVHLAACEGEVSAGLLLVWETLLWSIVRFHPCWPLGPGQEIAWEDMGKRVWELVYRNAYVLKGVGYDGESEHSWGHAQIAKVLHLTFQQSITIQWWVVAPMEKKQAMTGFCRQLQTALLCA